MGPSNIIRELMPKWLTDPFQDYIICVDVTENRGSRRICQCDERTFVRVDLGVRACGVFKIFEVYGVHRSPGHASTACARKIWSWSCRPHRSFHATEGKIFQANAVPRQVRGKREPRLTETAWRTWFSYKIPWHSLVPDTLRRLGWPVRSRRWLIHIQEILARNCHHHNHHRHHPSIHDTYQNGAGCSRASWGPSSILAWVFVAGEHQDPIYHHERWKEWSPKKIYSFMPFLKWGCCCCCIISIYPCQFCNRWVWCFRSYACFEIL